MKDKKLLVCRECNSPVGDGSNLLTTEMVVTCKHCGKNISGAEYNLRLQILTDFQNVGEMIKMIRDEDFNWEELNKNKKRTFRRFLWKITVMEEKWITKKFFLRHRVPVILQSLTQDQIDYIISEWTNKRIKRSVGKLNIRETINQLKKESKTSLGWS